MKAYKTSAIGVRCVVFAKSRGAARHAIVMAANDAGFDITYSDVDFVRREPTMDHLAGERSIKPNRCYSPFVYECWSPFQLEER